MSDDVVLKSLWLRTILTPRSLMRVYTRWCSCMAGQVHVRVLVFLLAVGLLVNCLETRCRASYSPGVVYLGDHHRPHTQSNPMRGELRTSRSLPLALALLQGLCVDMIEQSPSGWCVILHCTANDVQKMVKLQVFCSRGKRRTETHVA